MLPEDIGRATASRHGQLQWARGRVLGFVPGLDTLDAVKAALGAAGEGGMGDRRVVALCYRARAMEDDTTVTFQALDSDPGRVVQAIVVAQEADRPAGGPRCARSRSVARDTAAVGPLRLGATPEQVKALLKDRPTLDTRDTLRYDYWMPAAGRPGCGVYSGVIVRMLAGRVAWFASYRETYCPLH
jgi:hypothetical protein